MKEATASPKDAALELALEALTNSIAVRKGEGGTKLVSPLEENTITAIKEALAQDEKGLFIDLIAQHEGLAEELAQDEQSSSQEPVHSVQSNGRHSPLLTHMMNKRTTPPKRQPLTLNEISAMEEKVYMRTTHKGKPLFEYAQALIRAVEAAHGIGVNT